MKQQIEGQRKVMRRLEATFAVVAALAGSGCARPLAASSHVPNPLTGQDTAQEANYDLVIRIKDIKQPEGLAHESTLAGVNTPSRGGEYMVGYVEPRYFPQAASIKLARKDEIHVALFLSSEWPELADLEHYKIELRDDRGQKLSPADQWVASHGHRDYEGGYQVIKNFQNVRIHEWTGATTVYNMWAPDPQYVNERVYTTRGLVVFRSPNLLRPDTRSITVTLSSSTRTLRFTWHFTPPSLEPEKEKAGAAARPGLSDG